MHLPGDDSFINIHTHKTDFGQGEFALLNIFAQNFQSYELNEKYAYSAGFHPWHVAEDTIESNLDTIRHAARLSAVIAIGETGLDRAIKTPLEVQMKAFIPQVEIAEELNKPVVLHCVRTFSEMLQLRKKRKFSVPWIFHGFTGNMQIAKQLIDYGGYLSFGKFLLNPKSKIPALFSQIPDEFIFLEIDDSSFTINQVYNEACRLKGYSQQTMKKIIFKNFIRCFFDGKRK